VVSCPLEGNLPLPNELPSLPDVDEVEGWFFGEGFTAREWAAWVGQPVDLVRERLDVLFQGGTLAYDNATERYAVRCVESAIDSPPA